MTIYELFFFNLLCWFKVTRRYRQLVVPFQRKSLQEQMELKVISAKVSHKSFLKH